MKKILAILSALLALSGCTKEMEAPAVQEDEQPIAVNLTIDRIDAFEDVDTRASVKTNWAEGDVVFVFFKGIAPPKYLEMKFTEGKWVATPMNGLTASDLSNATEKRMSANYLPYGSYATLQADGEVFLLDQPYNGVFYYAKPTAYSYDSELHGALSLKVYNPINDYTYVHFDVSGYTNRHAYALYQDNVKAISLTQLGYGTTSTSMQLGDPLAGHIDKERGVLTFSGVVDNSVIGKETDYQFSINDESASVLYTRDAGNHTLSKSTAVGLGDLSGSKWLATEYVYLGIDLTLYQKLCWAKKNVGATVDKGEGSYGKYYAYMKTTGYAPSGTFGNYTMSHPFNEENYNADPDGDPVHHELKGLWRLPTKQEFDALLSHSNAAVSDLSTVNAGVTLTSTVSGFTDQSVFFPAAGRSDDGMSMTGKQGWYWSSSKTTVSGDTFGYVMVFTGNEPITQGTVPTMGAPVRPVFSVPTLEAGVIDPLEHEYVEMGDGLGWATVNLEGTEEEPLGDRVGWADPDPATNAWGSQWRTPTNDEWLWLLDPANTTWESEYNEEVELRGFRITSKITGNSLFFPTGKWTDRAGYWSSTPEEGPNSRYVTLFYYDSNEISAGGVLYGNGTEYLRPVMVLHR